jgi:hypothetical protein
MNQRFVKAMAISLLVASTGMAQDTSKNVNTLTAPELSGLPIIDGDLSDAVWANVPEIIVNGNGDSPAPTTPGDLDIVMKVAWDEESNALLFGFSVVDDVFINLLSRGSSLGDGGYNNERMELIINGANTGDAGHGEDSVFHTQYTFDLPTTWDAQPGGINDLPVSSSFVSVPVLEGIDGSIQAPAFPFDFDDTYVESAARIRVTDPNATEWLEAPVEWTWEFKVVVYDELFSAGAFGYDTNDAALIAEGFKAFFEDSGNIIHDLNVNDVIGISPQQNDADVFSQSPEREHQVNTTNVAGNWNSSADLTGLILAAQTTNVSDWELMK